jgi:putative nucleotidyltransferase with HDIG domain
MTRDRELHDRLERRIDQLPVLPTVVGRLMVLDRDDESFFEQVLDLVESDPTFAARILASANSSASSPRTPVTSVRGSLARLGSTGASNMILAAAVSRVFVPRDDWERSLWRHSLQVAGALRAMSTVADTTLELNGDEAYAAGLLHDIGRFVMFGEAPDSLRQIDEGEWDTPEALLEVERSICGMTHGELGKMACVRWGLPESLGEVVRRHHEPDVDSTAGPAEALLATLHFADLAMFPSAMPGVLGYAAAGVEAVDADLISKLPLGLNLSASALHAIITDVTSDVDQTCATLGIA